MIPDLPRKGNEKMATKPKMKIPTARQLPSGSWFCRVRVDGQDIPITRDTEKEAIAEAMAIKAGIKEAAKQPKKKTVYEAIDDYIVARKNILSPSTIAGYRRIQKHRFESMMKKDIHKLTAADWQRAVNLEAKVRSQRDSSKTISAKTLKNAWGLMTSVIAEATGEEITVRLPQIVPHQKAWLTAEQIPDFVKLIKDDPIEIPALLALSSLRRSELINLRWSDVDLQNDVLKVDGAAVFDEDGTLVRKEETKNASSRRTVPIIPPLHEALEKAEHRGDYIVTWHPNSIMCRINRICEKNGLPKVGLHGLRHSFASLAKHLGMPEDAVMEIGGWSDHNTMRKIYTHISEADVTKHSQNFTAFFSPPQTSPDAQNGNENGNAE